MADVLVRNLSSGAKEALASRAARNGRSQQAEAKAILEAALQDDAASWVSRLRRAASAVGGIDLEAPARHAPREMDVAGWL
ncbi:MAG: hypothetical protein Q4C41_01210 [Eggerthellaceae bacterium]|nr:hypothetical protein [Eggerthellaceae bacterium]